MNHLCWNCRGVGNPRTVRVLHDLIRDRKPDVLFLMETIASSNMIEKLRIKFGFANCFSVDRVGRSGGLAVFWKHNVDCGIASYSNNHIDLEFKDDNVVSWRLTCFYGYPERSRRKESWDLIRSWLGCRVVRGVFGVISMTCFIVLTKGGTTRIQGR